MRLMRSNESPPLLHAQRTALTTIQIWHRSNLIISLVDSIELTDEYFSFGLLSATAFIHLKKVTQPKRFYDSFWVLQLTQTVLSCTWNVCVVKLNNLFVFREPTIHILWCVMRMAYGVWSTFDEFVLYALIAVRRKLCSVGSRMRTIIVSKTSTHMANDEWVVLQRAHRRRVTSKQQFRELLSVLCFVSSSPISAYRSRFQKNAFFFSILNEVQARLYCSQIKSRISLAYVCHHISHGKRLITKMLSQRLSRRNQNFIFAIQKCTDF